MTLGSAADEVAIDGLAAPLTLTLGAGADIVSVGQLYNAQHSFHSFVERTTQGYLSSAGTQSIVVNAGDDNDVIRVLKNDGSLVANGECGSDVVSDRRRRCALAC